MIVFVPAVTNEQRREIESRIQQDVRFVGHDIEITVDEDVPCVHANEETVTASEAVSVVNQVLYPEDWGRA